MTGQTKFFQTAIYESGYNVPDWLFPFYLQNCKVALHIDKVIEQNLVQIIRQTVAYNRGLGYVLTDLYTKVSDIIPDNTAISQGPLYILTCTTQRDVIRRNKIRKRNGTLKERVYETDLSIIYDFDYEPYIPGQNRQSRQHAIENYYKVKEDYRQLIMIDRAKRAIIYNAMPREARGLIDAYIKQGNQDNAGRY